MAAEQFIINAYAAIVSWTYILLTILLIVKIVQFFTGGGLFGRIGEGGGGGGGRRPSPINVGPPKRKGHKPNNVINFRVDHRGDHCTLSWDANPTDEMVNYYWIERQRHARTPRGFSWNRNLWGNWRRIAYVSRNYTQANPFIDNVSFRNNEGVIKEWWNSLDPIQPGNDYNYRIRAVNSFGEGKWVYLRVSSNSSGVTVTITQPPANPPNPLAMRMVGDATVMNIQGNVTGAGGHYDHIWGLYDANTNNLVATIPCVANLASGTPSNFALNCAAAPLVGGPPGQIPVGNYRLFLFAQAPNPPPLAAPPNCTALPGTIIGQAERRIVIFNQRIRIEPNTNALAHPNPLHPRFGRTIPLAAYPGNLNFAVSFDVVECNPAAIGPQVFHVFVTDAVTGNILNTAQLADRGLANINVIFNGGAVVPWAAGIAAGGVGFAHRHNPHTANITVQFDYNGPLPVVRPNYLNVFVCVENGPLAPPLLTPAQILLDNRMWQYHALLAPNPGHIAFLAAGNVHDFNNTMVILL